MADMVGDYELVERLRVGNHGTYWKAVAPGRLNLESSTVVLKVLDGRGTPDDFRRAANELRLLHSLHHPNLVQLLDAGNASGSLFIATRWYPDGSLDDARARLSVDALIRAVADAADAAHAMHEVGVAHRDIKPGNIVLDGERGLLGDLGLAQLVGPDQTVGGGPIGTLGFIDPVVVRGDDADRRSDIFSLAATLHDVTTGTGVFGDIPTSSVFDACRHVLHTPPEADVGLAADLRAIIARALRVGAPAYATAAELADDLRRCESARKV